MTSKKDMRKEPFKNDLINGLRTPIKTNNLVLRPSYKQGEFDSHLVDCPFLFYHGKKYYMTYIGWDSIGYRTGLASSSDLFNWEKEGMILDRGSKGSVTEFNAALSSILRENELYGQGILKKINGYFIGTYMAYPRLGYEGGPGVIGLCYSNDLYKWECSEPILRAEDGMEWESSGLYKSYLLEHEGIYYIFYNATNRNRIEQIGVAMSHDLSDWKRHEGNPILKIGDKGSFDDRFVSDPCVFHYSNHWVMFYYALCNDDGYARDSVALSQTLLEWEKSNEILVDVGKSGSIDSVYAHKPGMISKDGHLYHFYCAVSTSNADYIDGVKLRDKEIRGISVAHN